MDRIEQRSARRYSDVVNLIAGHRLSTAAELCRSVSDPAGSYWAEWAAALDHSRVVLLGGKGWGKRSTASPLTVHDDDLADAARAWHASIAEAEGNELGKAELYFRGLYSAAAEADEEAFQRLVAEYERFASSSSGSGLPVRAAALGEPGPLGGYDLLEALGAFLRHADPQFSSNLSRLVVVPASPRR